MIFSGEERLRVQVGNNEQRIGRLFHVVSHVTFHVTFVTSAPLFGCVSRGALDDFFLTSSSRDMTATVLSNAALEKKKSRGGLVPLAFSPEGLQGLHCIWEQSCEHTMTRRCGGRTFGASISLLHYVVYCLRGAYWSQSSCMGYIYIAFSAESGATQPRMTSTSIRCRGVHFIIVKGPPTREGPSPADGLVIHILGAEKFSS